MTETLKQISELLNTLTIEELKIAVVLAENNVSYIESVQRKAFPFSFNDAANWQDVME